MVRSLEDWHSIDQPRYHEECDVCNTLERQDRTNKHKFLGSARLAAHLGCHTAQHTSCRCSAIGFV